MIGMKRQRETAVRRLKHRQATSRIRDREWSHRHCLILEMNGAAKVKGKIERSVRWRSVRSLDRLLENFLVATGDIGIECIEFN